MSGCGRAWPGFRCVQHAESRLAGRDACVALPAAPPLLAAANAPASAPLLAPCLPACRDALYLGDCDAGVRQLCQLLGWEAELDALIADGRQHFHPPPHSPAGEAGEAAA